MLSIKGLAPWKAALLVVAFDLVLLLVFGVLRALERVPWEAAFMVAGILSTGGRIPTAIRVFMDGSKRDEQDDDDDNEPPANGAGSKRHSRSKAVMVTGGAVTLLVGLLAWWPSEKAQ